MNATELGGVTAFSDCGGDKLYLVRRQTDLRKKMNFHSPFLTF